MFRFENMTSNDHVADEEEEDDVASMTQKQAAVLSEVQLAIQKNELKQKLKEEAKKEKDEALEAGKKLQDTPVVEVEEFRDVLQIEKELPPRDDPIWKDPIETMRIFHSYLGNRFSIESSEKDRDCQNQSGEIDGWQYVSFIPLLRVNELFVIAPTGTGKSWVMSQAATLFCTQEYLRKRGMRLEIPLDRPPRHVVYVIRGDKAKKQQAIEIMKNPAFRRMADRYFTPKDLKLFKENQGGKEDFKKNPVVDADFVAAKGLHKIVTFMTYAQAGNLLELNPNAFSRALLVVDEIHELQTAVDASGPRWAPSVRRFENFLNNRMSFPIVSRGMLLALTATPFKSREGFVRLMNYFCPAGIKRISEEEFVRDNEGEEDESIEEIERCGFSLDNILKEIPITRFIGFRLAYYSIDLDDNIYAQWLGEPKEWRVLVPSVRSASEMRWISRVTSKDPKQFLSGSKEMAIGDRKKWKKTSLLYVGRQRSIAISVAESLAKLNLDEENALKKTMLFFPTEVGSSTFITFYEELVGEDGPYNIIFLKNDDDASEQRTKKSLFDVGGDDTLLVTNTKEYGTGITFTDRELESRGMSRGPKRIFYVQPDAYTTAIQVEGRARRRCLHAGWENKELKIERIVIVPYTEKKGVEVPTCYKVMNQMTYLESLFVNSIAPSIFNASYTKESFWVRRPAQLLFVKKNDLVPVKDFDIKDATLPVSFLDWLKSFFYD